MPFRIVNYHRLALDDVRKTHHWYHRKSPWAAGRFVLQLDEAEAKIEAAAESYPVESRDVRWLLLPDYPYIVRFQIVDDHRCKIISVTHASRRPNHWVGRLSRP
jgi:plasmid stabilization system protein ParE